MKIRTGFVSNSSSSSFVIGKAYMTEHQIKRFSDFIQSGEYENGKGLDGYIEDSKYYFSGEVDNHTTIVWDFLEKIKVDNKFIYFQD